MDAPCILVSIHRYMRAETSSTSSILCDDRPAMNKCTLNQKRKHLSRYKRFEAPHGMLNRRRWDAVGCCCERCRASKTRLILHTSHVLVYLKPPLIISLSSFLSFSHRAGRPTLSQPRSLLVARVAHSLRAYIDQHGPAAIACRPRGRSYLTDPAHRQVLKLQSARAHRRARRPHLPAPTDPRLEI